MWARKETVRALEWDFFLKNSVFVKVKKTAEIMNTRIPKIIQENSRWRFVTTFIPPTISIFADYSLPLVPFEHAEERTRQIARKITISSRILVFISLLSFLPIVPNTIINS